MGPVAAEVSAQIQQHFMAAWLAVLLLVVAYAFWRWPARSAAPRPSSSPLSTADLAALAALVALLALCAFVMLYRADLADHDHSQLTRAIADHRPLTMPIWPRSGRFWPLGNQEFNLLLLFGISGVGFFIFSVLELAVLSAGMLVLLRPLPIPVRVAAVVLLLVSPSVQLVFHGLVYTERNLALLLVLIALGLRNYDRVPSRRSAMGALIATHLALYLKEPVFLLVAGIAASRILVDLMESGRPRRVRSFAVDHSLELALFALVAVFVGLYSLTMLPYRSMEYAESYAHRGTALGTLLYYLRADPILLPFFGMVTWRVVGVMRRRIMPDRLWEPLAAGAICYFTVYVALGMQSVYYMTPVDLLGILYLTVMVNEAIGSGRIRPLVPAAVAASLGVLLLMSTWYMLIRRKNIVASTAVLAEYVTGVADTSGAAVRVFMPLETNYAVMEFGALLEHKGAHVVADSAARRGGIVLHAPDETREGRCVPFSRIPCTHVTTAPPGSIVLIMAGDDPPPESHRSLRPAHAMVAVEPFGIPPILPVLHAVRAMLGGRDVTLRPDWLWAYAAIATEKADP